MSLNPEIVHVLLCWGTVPILGGCIVFRNTRCFVLPVLLGGGAFFHAWPFPNGLWDLMFHWVMNGLAFLIPLLFDKAQKNLERSFSRKQAHLQSQREKIVTQHQGLYLEKSSVQEKLERLQHRFALVQVMATKLEAGDILQTLGHMWKKRPGVKGCLILRRLTNGGWATAFTDEIFNAQDWIRGLVAHPSWARSRQIKRQTSTENQLTFPGQLFGSSCLLIPFSWDKETMAMGVLEMDSHCLEDSVEGFNIERKLVSVGLRRADLYDLMTERSRFDSLTGAYLRRSLTERLEDGLRKSHRYNTPLFFALMDIDQFKGLNDRWGHLMGDKVLIHLAQTVKRLGHPGVTLGRFGGDEFALILELESVTDVLSWFDRLRQALEETAVRDRDMSIRFSVSAGVSPYLPERPPITELLAQADQALYQAKRGGRNRVVIWKSPDVLAEEK